MFSEPEPLGRQMSLSPSPGTKSKCSTGRWRPVLVIVFSRVTGWTALGRSGCSSVARSVPFFTAAATRAMLKGQSSPTSSQKTTVPVSWQTRFWSPSATSMFCSMMSSTSVPVGDVSPARARASASLRSGGSSLRARM